MNNWIEWSGGQCPLNAGDVVRVKLGSGEKCVDRAGNFDWDHNRAGFDVMDDIVAYEGAE